ncbi:hypothetical protein HUG17_7655 [Dermatophagoides farinae]|uniref:Uncharacterized protein n=1 Tax=Dermatophagoides farinae TaxID=6954 RepID=A0A9D4SCV3_DERFA|nr:hypothetical protein HUG17_7655 [Dermatophagoides farinae]
MVLSAPITVMIMAMVLMVEAMIWVTEVVVTIADMVVVTNLVVMAVAMKPVDMVVILKSSSSYKLP